MPGTLLIAQNKRNSLCLTAWEESSAAWVFHSSRSPVHAHAKVACIFFICYVYIRFLHRCLLEVPDVDAAKQKVAS